MASGRALLLFGLHLYRHPAESRVCVQAYPHGKIVVPRDKRNMIAY